MRKTWDLTTSGTSHERTIKIFNLMIITKPFLLHDNSRSHQPTWHPSCNSRQLSNELAKKENNCNKYLKQIILMEFWEVIREWVREQQKRKKTYDNKLSHETRQENMQSRCHKCAGCGKSKFKSWVELGLMECNVFASYHAWLFLWIHFCLP